MAVVTLLTDFGLDDTYVGQVKGAILAVAPDATLVDLTHSVPPQDVQTGAFLLWSAGGSDESFLLFNPETSLMALRPDMKPCAHAKKKWAFLPLA